MQIGGVAAAVRALPIEGARQGGAGMAKEITFNADRAEARAVAGCLVELCGASGGLKGISGEGGAGQGDGQNGRSLGELRVARLGVDHGSGDGACGEIDIEFSSAGKFADLC